MKLKWELVERAGKRENELMLTMSIEGTRLRKLIAGIDKISRLENEGNIANIM